MKYEIFWKPKSSCSGCDIEADSPEEAVEMFLEMVRDNAGADDVEVNPLGEDGDSADEVLSEFGDGVYNPEEGIMQDNLPKFE